MLLAVALLGCSTDPADVVGEAVEIGADDPVWDPRSLPVYRLTLPGDWEAQLAALIPTDNCADRESIFGSLDYENPQSGETESYADVAVRYRGHSALTEGQRFGLKVAFDKQDPDARFHGEKQVNLQGTEGDYSEMHERAAQLLMAQLDVPAPKVIHARVYVNDEFQGIFPLSEEPDDQPFLDAHFADPDGHLYKVEGYCGGRADFAYESDDPDDYDKLYEAKAGTAAEDVATDLVPLLKCASGKSGTLVTCLPPLIDVDEWLTEMAVDTTLPDPDGLAAAGQNFMMYADPADGRFVVYGWDKDQATYTDSLESTSIWDFHPSWADSPQLTQDLRAGWAEDYCERVEAAVTAAQALDTDLAELQAFLAPYVATDPFLTDHQWSAQVDEMQADLQARAVEVAREAKLCSP